MPDTSESNAVQRFPLTPRQVRLRYLTWILLAVIVLMIAFGVLHPVFRMTPPAALTDHLNTIPAPRLRAIRQAFALKLLLIGIYWATCLIFTLMLPVFAWLYAREIRLQELMARRDYWRDLSGKQAPGADRDESGPEMSDSTDQNGAA